MITIEPTAHQHIIKFLVDDLYIKESIELSREDNLSMIPIAQKLFSFPFIEKMILTGNIIGVQKNDTVDWEIIQDELQSVIEEELDKNPTLFINNQLKTKVYAEMTPNPAVVKFVTNQLLYNGNLEFKSPAEAKEVPLALELFEFEYIEEVFISENFVSLTQKQGDWAMYLEEIRSFIHSYLFDNKEIVSENYIPIPIEKPKKEYSSIEQKIMDVLQEYIIPAVAQDGGNIELIEYDAQTKQARLLLQGSCSGCPSSTATLKHGVHNVLNELMPGEIEEVIAVNG